MSRGEDERTTDIGVAGGNIVAMEDALSADAEILDAGGRLVIPGFVESHIHLDKACILDRCKSEHETLVHAIRDVAQAKKSFTVEDIRSRASATIEKCIVQGTTACARTWRWIRDRDQEHRRGAAPGTGVCLGGRCGDLRVSPGWSFEQSGLTRSCVQALKDGATVVGGCPYTDSDPRGQIARVFAIAREFDVDIDFHLDFDTNPDGMTVDEVCELTDDYGYGGRVAIGHVSKLSALDADQLARVAARLASAGVAVTVLPSTDLFLMGAEMNHDVVRGVAPVHRLIGHGVNCALSTNNVLNPFTPFGDCSMVRMANLYANIAQIGSGSGLRECLEMVTHRPARLMRKEDYGLAVGNPADMIVLDCATATDAVRELASPLFGFKRGRRTFTRAPAELHRPGK